MGWGGGDPKNEMRGKENKNAVKKKQNVANYAVRRAMGMYINDRASHFGCTTIRGSRMGTNGRHDQQTHSVLARTRSKNALTQKAKTSDARID